MTTSKPRVRAYVDHDTYAKLQFATSRPHVTVSDTVNNTLKVYLSDDYKFEHDNAVLRRLDQMTRQHEMSKQKANVMAEAFALFVRYYLTITPEIPVAQRQAANALGESRFNRYRDDLKTVLSHTSRHLFGMMDDVYLEENSFFTEAELDALSRVAADEALRKEPSPDQAEKV